VNTKSTVTIFFTEGHDADCSNRKRGDFSDSARTPDAEMDVTTGTAYYIGPIVD
jgi:hypothetical protein